MLLRLKSKRKTKIYGFKLGLIHKIDGSMQIYFILIQDFYLFVQKFGLKNKNLS